LFDTILVQSRNGLKTSLVYLREKSEVMRNYFKNSFCNCFLCNTRTAS